MNEVTVNKTKLLEIVRANREDHIRIYNESFEAFKGHLAGVLEGLLQEVSEGKIPDYGSILHKVTRPQNHAREYDRAIKMLEMEVEVNVVLSAQEFASLVDDEWEWSRSWAFSNSSYTKHKKVLKFIGDESC